MLRSMTGYGQASHEINKFAIKVEIRSLNNKFLDINLRLPKPLQSRELIIRSELSKLLERGSVNVSVNLELKDQALVKQDFNHELAGQYLKELKAVATAQGLSTDTLAQVAASLPDVWSGNETELTESDWTTINKVIRNAFGEFDKFRKSEGKALIKQFKSNTKQIQARLKKVEKHLPSRTQQMKERLHKNLEVNGPVGNIDPNRFEQEVLYYIEKLDISEEIVRLNNHCSYFLENLEKTSSGKKLGFISQEMGREINTMGAKANHLEIQREVVEMKEELEKIKEQLMNVL